jgi:hypothetical protein
MMMIIRTMAAAAVVDIEATTLIYYSLLLQNRNFDLDFGLEIRIVDTARVEMIDKRSILCLETTTNR